MTSEHRSRHVELAFSTTSLQAWTRPRLLHATSSPAAAGDASLQISSLRSNASENASVPAQDSGGREHRTLSCSGGACQGLVARNQPDPKKLGEQLGMREELISVTEIAKTHSRHRSSLHKIIKRLGIETRRIRSEEARGQEAVYITLADYSLLKAEIEYEEDGALPGEEPTEWRGFLYIVQLEPEFDPGRLKIGFATSVEDRLKSHRTSAPFAKVLRQWPCKLLWEKTAIEAITRDCEKLHTEVFRTNNIEIVVAESFFNLMPKLYD